MIAPGNAAQRGASFSRPVIRQDNHEEIRWHLRASNGEIIASSQGYKSKAAAEKGIDSVKANAPGATVVDNTG
jgi:uncharacterized protein